MDEAKKLNPTKIESKLIILPFENVANPHRDEQGRTPLHNFATIQGTSPESDAEFAGEAEHMIDIFLNSGVGILDKDIDGNTALDLALKINPAVKSVKEVFIKRSLLADLKLDKPSSLTSDLSTYWDECIRNQQPKTKSQQSTSSSSTAFFKAPAPSNAATYDAKEKDDVHKRHRLN
jgi:hypothetical protein